jgi:hypothetical protein
MTAARNLRRHDTLDMMLPAKVLAVTPLAGGRIKIKVEAGKSPSLEFADDCCVLEIICKSYRAFSAYPSRRDRGGGGGRRRKAGIDPLSPTTLEPVG